MSCTTLPGTVLIDASKYHHNPHHAPSHNHELPGPPLYAWEQGVTILGSTCVCCEARAAGILWETPLSQHLQCGCGGGRQRLCRQVQAHGGQGGQREAAQGGTAALRGSPRRAPALGLPGLWPRLFFGVLNDRGPTPPARLQQPGNSRDLTDLRPHWQHPQKFSQQSRHCHVCTQSMPRRQVGLTG